MGMNQIFVLICLLVLLAINCSGADVEGKAEPKKAEPKFTMDPKNNTNEKTGIKDPASNPVIKNNDQVSRSKDGVKNDKNNSSKQVEKKEDHNVDQGGSGSKTQGKDSDKQEKMGKVVEPREKQKGESNVGSSGGEECDALNSCKDVETKLVACLRVPGNDSPDLSLLIQNKGKGTLTVAISAPDYVKLEKKQVVVTQKDNEKVTVSVRKGGVDNSIVLTAGKGQCRLNFTDLIAHSTIKETDTTPKSRYIIFLSQTPSMVFVSLAAALTMIASACVWVSIRRRRSIDTDTKYQKLDMELPIASVESKTEEQINDGWDNSWDDDWDDEEAPNTPSMPITPSLSSKGLSSRRLNKEGWKD